ncbi:MAG: NADH-ubiquinone oxidoreductase-F iron-sulfur binding region domain-containing protein [Acidimicrobiales bacterium]
MTGPSGLPRLLAGLRPDGRPLSLAEHAAHHGPLPPRGRRRGPDRTLIEVVGRSGLQGRGGAGFPTGRKLASVVDQGSRPVVVANGAEGEPASAKDRVLMQRAPHLVLDGAQVAAWAVGATEVIVAVCGEAPEVLAVLRHAVAERTAGCWDHVQPAVLATPERFIAGEESALVALLNGRAPKPTFVPPRPYQRGVGGRPTLVQNVETLAHLALIARNGPEWFRGLGTAAEPGSTLVTLGGAVARPGVYEIPRGASMSYLLSGAGGTTASVQAHLVGGYGGTWVRADTARDVPLCDEALAGVGGMLGPGVVVALPAGACGLAETARVLSYLAREGAGQCGPCTHGLGAMVGAMSSVARGDGGAAAIGHLRRWASQVTGRGACHHPDGAARLATSALRVFRADLAAHVHGHPCSGARCSPVLAVPGPLTLTAGAR